MTAATFARLCRPATLPAPVAGVAGGAFAAAGGRPADTVALACALLSAVLLTGASNGLNQIADLETDRINRPDRPLPSGAITVRQAWLAVAAMLFASMALGVRAGWGYLVCAAVTVPVTAAYSFPPLRTKRIPLLANATIALPRGMLLVVAGWAVAGGFLRTEAWLLGGVAFLYVFGAATTKDFADVAGDRATGCVTLPILLGPNAAARFVAPFLVAPFLLYPLFAWLGWLPRTVLAWAALGVPLAALGGAAAILLVRSPAPPASGRPHPAWGIMYAQLVLAHVGTAVVLAGT
jgi:4-hydroxybenzoate polyprenyltransferase